MRKACLRYVSSSLPSLELSNQDLCQEFPDWTADKIFAKTGIEVRHIAGPDECSSDLAVNAAMQLFERHPEAKDEIDFVLLCTQSPDYFLPASACLAQARLGLPKSVGALDINQGCSGFVYGLALAKGLVESGQASGVLLLTAETYSKYINKRDRSTRTIFGDAGAATLVVATESDRDLLGPFVFGTDGSGAKNLIVPVGAARQPKENSNVGETVDGDGNVRTSRDLYMNGPEIFNFTLRTVPAAVRGVLAAAEADQKDIDLFIFHQANAFMLKRLRAKLEIEPDRFWQELRRTGNTVSATIPIAIEQARSAGRLLPGQQTMLVGFGVGYSWAACLFREV